MLLYSSSQCIVLIIFVASISLLSLPPLVLFRGIRRPHLLRLLCCSISSFFLSSCSIVVVSLIDIVFNRHQRSFHEEKNDVPSRRMKTVVGDEFAAAVVVAAEVVGLKTQQ